MCALLFFAVLLGSTIYLIQREHIRRWCIKNGIDFKDHWRNVRQRGTVSPY